MINGKQKGNAYELKIVCELKEMGFEAESSRNASRKMDALGVDIVTNFPFHIQCKRVERLFNPEGILTNMPNDKKRVIFTKKNRKPELVIMFKRDFYELIGK